MNDIIFNVLSVQGQTIPVWVPLLGGIPINAFLPPLAGSFLGVIGGFAVNYLYQRHNTGKERTIYKEMIKDAINHCISILEKDQVKLLPVSQWDSAVNSGALRLLKPGDPLKSYENRWNLIVDFGLSDLDILQQLSVVYGDIKSYNISVTEYKFGGLPWSHIEEGVSVKDSNRSNLLLGRLTLQGNLKELSKHLD